MLQTKINDYYALFQIKTLKSFLQLSKTAPTPAIPLLTGELPVEGKIHKDVLSLFYSIWSNPDTKIYSIVKYLTQNCEENSRTWSAHIRHLCRKYNMEDPFMSLCKDPPSRAEYKELVATKIAAFYEKKLSKEALKNSLMSYLNVSTLGLRGRHHPAIMKMVTSREVKLSFMTSAPLGGGGVSQSLTFC